MSYVCTDPVEIKESMKKVFAKCKKDRVLNNLSSQGIEGVRCSIYFIAYFNLKKAHSEWGLCFSYVYAGHVLSKWASFVLMPWEQVAWSCFDEVKRLLPSLPKQQPRSTSAVIVCMARLCRESGGKTDTKWGYQTEIWMFCLSCRSFLLAPPGVKSL